MANCAQCNKNVGCGCKLKFDKYGNKVCASCLVKNNKTTVTTK